MADEKLSKLEAIAVAAPSEPWRFGGPFPELNRYIEAAAPGVVLDLIDRIRRLEAEVRKS